MEGSSLSILYVPHWRKARLTLRNKFVSVHESTDRLSAQPHHQPESPPTWAWSCSGFFSLLKGSFSCRCCLLEIRPWDSVELLETMFDCNRRCINKDELNWQSSAVRTHPPTSRPACPAHAPRDRMHHTGRPLYFVSSILCKLLSQCAGQLFSGPTTLCSLCMNLKEKRVKERERLEGRGGEPVYWNFKNILWTTWDQRCLDLKSCFPNLTRIIICF